MLLLYYIYSYIIYVIFSYILLYTIIYYYIIDLNDNKVGEKSGKLSELHISISLYAVYETNAVNYNFWFCLPIFNLPIIYTFEYHYQS